MGVGDGDVDELGVGGYDLSVRVEEALYVADSGLEVLDLEDERVGRRGDGPPGHWLVGLGGGGARGGVFWAPGLRLFEKGFTERITGQRGRGRGWMGKRARGFPRSTRI